MFGQPAVILRFLYFGLTLLLVTSCDRGDFSSVLEGGQLGFDGASCVPTITTATPNVVSQSGGPLSLSGLCFKSGMQVYVAGRLASGSVVDEESWSGAAPSTTAYGAVTLVVVNPDKKSSSLPGGLVYQGPPQITGLTPPSGALTGGTTVSVIGAGFLVGATIKFGASGSALPLSVINPAQATVTAPAGVAGLVDIIVTNPDNQSVTLTNGYKYQPAPMISAITPISGAATGGTTVTIFGTNFLSDAQVLFGGIAASDVAVTIDGLRITATTPPFAPGVADLKVVNGDAQFGTLLSAYTFTGVGSPPTVVSVSPTSGSTSGGQAIVVTGTNFQTGATVSIGGVLAAVTTVTATTISATTAAKAGAGTFSLTVTNPDTQTSTLGNAYSYNDPPILSSISPSGGPLTGGNTVTLTGSNFATGASVRIGGNLCAPLLGNATTATCPAPAGSTGAKAVTFTNPDGTSSTLPLAYTYNPAPTVTSISPNAGKLAAGTMATITGTNFQAGASATVGGSPAGVLATSATSLFISLPSGTAGARDVVVTNADGQSATLANGYLFQPAPAVASVSPSTGAVGGGTAITISGTGFLSGTTVSIGSSAVSGLTYVSSTTLTGFTTSGSTGTRDVTASNPDGQTGNLSNGFTYASGPTISSASPAAGALAGNTLVNVTGTNFTSPMTVTINGTAGTSVTVGSPTTLSFRTPANTAGTYAVVVTDSYSQSATLPNAFTYNSAPTISSISPSAGPLAGGTAVTIAGTGFIPGASISIGGSALGSLSIGPTQITGTTGANTDGTYSAVVTNPDSQSGTGGTFMYRSPPTLSSIAPTGGSTSGGTVVTLTGTSFYSAMTVSIGGVACTPVTVLTSTSATCTTGFSPAGVKNVTVTNSPDAQSVTQNNMFTYRSPPIVVSVSPSVGFIGGENRITISGTGFETGATVTLGASGCTSVSVLPPSAIECTTTAAASPGPVSITVTNADAQTDTLANAFTYKNDAFSVVDQYLGNVSPNGYIDGTGSDARFSGPYGVTVDSSGNIYAVESVNCTVRMITPSGVTTTLAGMPLSCTMTDGPGASARFRTPLDITIDPSETNLYVSEWGAIRQISLTPPYDVTTLAGSGSAQGGTNGVGSSARFQYPRGITIDDTGTTLYVANTDRHTIRAIDIATATVTTIAGVDGAGGSTDNATGTSARFNSPRGIAWTSDGNLYVSDYSTHSIRQVSLAPPHAVTRVVGNGAAGSADGVGAAARLYNPFGIAWDGANTLWVGDGNGTTVRSIDMSTWEITTYFGTYNNVGSSDDVYNSARFNGIFGITAGSSYLYVADYNNHSIRRISTTTGMVDTLAGVPNSYGYTDGSAAVAKMWTPQGLSIIADNLYVLEWGSCLIRKVDLSNVVVSTLAGQAASCAATDGSGTYSARFHRAAGLTTDGTHLFMADTSAHSARRINVTNASVNTLAGLNGYAGNSDGTGTTARFDRPYGIAVIGTDIFLADSYNHVIRKIQSTGSITNGGIVTVLAGIPNTAGWIDGAGASAKFNNPRGLTAVGTDLYVADYSNCVIRKIDTSTGVVSTIAGTQGTCDFADGIGTLAKFNNPFGITNDGDNLYVTDFTNHSVRKIVISSKVVSTLFGDRYSAYDNVGGALSTSNMRNPTGILWSAKGLFIANDYGIKRVH